MQKLRQQVSKASMDPPRYGPVTFTWGNASAADHERGMVVTKSSGVDYQTMTVDDMVVVGLYGNVAKGRCCPSFDTTAHLALYRHYSSLGGVIRIHSTHATAQAQANLAILVLGTTHAGYFFGDIPCARTLTETETQNEYELDTSRVIVETLGEMEPLHTPDVVVY